MFTTKFGFTIKPSVKIKKTPSNTSSSTNKQITRILYCTACKNEEGIWFAHINTRGIEGYEEVTILPFTEKSFDLKGRTDVFYREKDKYNHYIHVLRNSFLAELNPGSTELYCTLAENSIFSGYIVKIDGILQFDMSSYKGELCECNILIERDNEHIGD